MAPPVYGMVRMKTDLTIEMITRFRADWSVTGSLGHFDLTLSDQRPLVDRRVISLSGLVQFFSITTTKKDCLADLDRCENGE